MGEVARVDWQLGVVYLIEENNPERAEDRSSTITTTGRRPEKNWGGIWSIGRAEGRAVIDPA